MKLWGHIVTIYLSKNLPHVDEILCQGNTLTVSTDGDSSVKICWSISVLTVGDSYHRATNLSENIF